MPKSKLSERAIAPTGPQKMLLASSGVQRASSVVTIPYTAPKVGRESRSEIGIEERRLRSVSTNQPLSHRKMAFSLKTAE
jgi:hypothetical protein